MTISLALKLINLSKHSYNTYMGRPQEQTLLEKIQKLFEEALAEESAWRKDRYTNDSGYISKKHIDRIGDVVCFCLSIYSIKIIFDVALHIFNNVLFKTVVCGGCFIVGLGIGRITSEKDVGWYTVNR